MSESKIGYGCSIAFMLFIWPIAPLLAIGFGMLRVHDAKGMFESFEETSGIILDGWTETYEVSEQDEDGYDIGTYVAGYRPVVRFEYYVDGKYFDRGEYAPEVSLPLFDEREEAKAEVAKYEVDESYPVWYRNDEPDKAYLHVGDIGDYTMLRNVGIFFFFLLPALVFGLTRLSK